MRASRYIASACEKILAFFAGRTDQRTATLKTVLVITSRRNGSA